MQDIKLARIVERIIMKIKISVGSVALIDLITVLSMICGGAVWPKVKIRRDVSNPSMSLSLKMKAKATKRTTRKTRIT